MKILNDLTPTSDISSVKIGDQISNGLGTFGEVEEIIFDNGTNYWEFTFKLLGGGLIQIRKTITSC